ncbi:MAG TPA: HAD family phosphatase [Pirellulales bacterium]|jgi:beta-phosphoglucomutase|nr:HAD family phosphatase [Pirellulales bacterium]
MYGVIFDVDGVLVDSYTAHFQSWRQVAEDRGYELSEEDFRRTFGRTSREIIAELWGRHALAAAEIAELDRRKEAAYRAILGRHVPLMDGAVELIDSLAGAGFALAVGSSGPPENVNLVLNALGRRAAFRGVVTGQEVTRGKPDPQVFLLAAKKIDVPADHCAVIEDAAVGIAAAQAAEMTAIGLVSTGHDPASLAAADCRVSSLRELDPQHIARLITGTSC